MTEANPATYEIVCQQLGCEYQTTKSRAQEARIAALEHSKESCETEPGHYVQVRTDNPAEEYPVAGFYFNGERKQADQDDDESEDDARYPDDGRRLAPVDTIVVSPDTLLFALRHEHEIAGERTHAFRVDPPFTQQVSPELEVIDPRYSNLRYRKADHQVPFYIPLQAFLSGCSDGWILSDQWQHPNQTIERIAYYVQQGIPLGTELTDDQQAEWNERWRNTVTQWKNMVREALKDEIDLAAAIREHVDTPVDVEYESEWEWEPVH